MGEFCNNIELQLNQINQSLPVIDFISVNVSSVLGVCREIETLQLNSAIEAKYSEPMVLVGWYITMASDICYAGMMSEMILQICSKRFWFPIRFFAFNAASITVIAAAMKLPMDLSSSMPSEVDQVTKVGSLGFLCIMMSNLMPSLAVMDNKSLVANVTGLSILVITLVVNVGIQIKTQVIRRAPFHPFSMPPFMAAYIYMGMLLCLLIIFISSAVTIPTLKKLIEIKYEATLNDQNLQENQICNAERLRKLLRKHWIMAVTSSPQFVLASTPLSSASSMIGAISIVVYILLSWHVFGNKDKQKSVYGNSTAATYVMQSLGVLGGVGSIYRCFAVLWLKSSANQDMNHFSVFKVEKYWTQKLCEWKESPISFFSFEINHNLKSCILIICIQFQKAIVVSCKIIELIPNVTIIFFIYCSYYFKSLKEMLFKQPIASTSEDTDEDLSNYVLLLEDDVQLTNYSWKRILDFMKILSLASRFIVRVSYKNLPQLLEKSDAFKGVEKFDTDEIQSLLPVELVNSWSLPIISLTCIAIVIPNIRNDLVDNLFKSVCEGISCTHIVEDRLNRESVYVNIRRATLKLWYEVKNKRKWLGTTLERSAYEGKTPSDIIKSFAHTAEDIVTEFNRGANGEPVKKENLPSKVIAAHSMYRIAQTIMHTYESNNLEIIEDELFSRLSVMIADILAACLTNIPKVIMMQCRDIANKKHEDIVMFAAIFVERTRKIIKKLEACELPNMDSEKMGYIDEWRLHFKHP